MIAAVVPVAFFIEDHIDMTVRFLDRLHDEVDRIGVWHNGGPLAEEGWRALGIFKSLDLFPAEEMTFYAMWNAGAVWATGIGADALLVLNNDIDWPPGALRALGEALVTAAPDIAVASPDPAAEFHPDGLKDIFATPAYRGLIGWCFAVRPQLWQPIDERYLSWYGDDEFGLLMHAAGYRCVRASGIPAWHDETETTMRHVPNIWDVRAADEQLYLSKWGSRP